MSATENFFVDQQYEKWRRITAYLRGLKDREFVTIADLARDTNYFPHEIIDQLTIAGVRPVWRNDYRITDILEALP